MAIETIQQIIDGNAAAGQFYFSPDTMRFFRSRVMSRVFPVPDGAVFVTSEKNDWSPRTYTVRRFYESTGEVETVDFPGFQEYATYNGAMKAAERYANTFKGTE